MKQNQSVDKTASLIHKPIRHGQQMQQVVSNNIHGGVEGAYGGVQ